MRYPVALNLRIESDLRTVALAKARHDGLSLAEVVRRLLRMWLAGDVTLPEPGQDEVDTDKD